MNNKLANACFCMRVVRTRAALVGDVRGSVAGARGRGVADSQSIPVRQSVSRGRCVG